MDTPQVTIATYMRAWETPAAAERMALVARVWADDGEYTEPHERLVGREALSAFIGAFLDSAPGARFVFASAVDTHHGLLRFGWRIVLGEGPALLEGLDFEELPPDGRLCRIVGFFGPLPVLPETQAATAGPGAG